MDGGAGPCSLELTVRGADGKPVVCSHRQSSYQVRFWWNAEAYLEAGTNADGKVKFAGLPDRVQRPPLEFHASKDEFMGIVTYDPSAECQAKRDITLEKS